MTAATPARAAVIRKASITEFQKQVQYLLQTGEWNFKATRVEKHQNIYLCGDRAEAIYFIDRGQIKLLIPSLEGNESLVAVYAKGDLFGETCLATQPIRAETATAMEHAIIRRIPSNAFLSHLSKYSLIEKFVQYLIDRMIEHQQLIARSMTLDSEHMLAWTILLLARKLGMSDPPIVRLEHKITHQELSEMVGTTRPRVTEFIGKFRDLEMIEFSDKHFLVVNEEKLSEYLGLVS